MSLKDKESLLQKIVFCEVEKKVYRVIGVSVGTVRLVEIHTDEVVQVGDQDLEKNFKVFNQTEVTKAFQVLYCAKEG